MQVIDTDLVTAYLSNCVHYASVTYEISKHRKGGVAWEYIVYEMDGLGEGYTTRFSEIGELEAWLIANTRTI